MDVRLLTPEGVAPCRPAELPRLLAADGGVLWVDADAADPELPGVLSEVFRFHPRAVEAAVQRNPVPRVHLYDDHLFVVLHAPEPGQRGHVHYVEIDQFVSRRYLVTVHGPVNPAVSPAAARVEVDAVAARTGAGRLHVATGYELSTAVVSALTGRMRDLLADRTTEVWRFEQQVTAGEFGDVERFLEGMFRVRHGLLTVRTMAAQSAEVYGRMHALAVFGPDGQPLLDNNADQFRRIATMAHSQEDYLQGVIEFYQARTTTKMTIAAERLAVIAAVTLPITALSSVMGMNVIVNSSTDPVFLTVLLVVMAVSSVLLLVWARRHGWF
jgi:Mg2+ and Co2+ transporter CorA